ncbi:MAG: response regulator transcription factor [Vicinamibacterales bacterium]
MARVRALLRRLERVAPHAGNLTYGPLAIDLDRHLVTVDGRETRLTAKEFLLLQYLMTHRGRVLSRDLLLSDVWDYSYTGSTRTVDVHVRRLREKLPFLVDALVTVKQFGYSCSRAGAGGHCGRTPVHQRLDDVRSRHQVHDLRRRLRRGAVMIAVFLMLGGGHLDQPRRRGGARRRTGGDRRRSRRRLSAAATARRARAIVDVGARYARRPEPTGPDYGDDELGTAARALDAAFSS